MNSARETLVLNYRHPAADTKQYVVSGATEQDGYKAVPG